MTPKRRRARSRVERVAVVSMHTCPLDQPGTGDAGGMNVYVRAVSSRLASMGVAVDVFTRSAGPEQHVVDIDPGVRVVHLDAGPNEPVPKADLPHYLWPFLCGLIQFEAGERERLGGIGPIYDVVHTHYWLSGWAGRLLRERLGTPLVHSFHTLGRVKNSTLSPGEEREPPIRLRGEERIAQTADLLLAPTPEEAADLESLYAAPVERVRVVPPGVDTDKFRPGEPEAARRATGLSDRRVVLFVGRFQPLKRPELALHAVADLAGRRPDLASTLALVMIGGPSGGAGITADSLGKLASSLGIADIVQIRDPVPHLLLPDHYRAADVVIMPSATESFGLVALESQACGTPVVASNVGGLRSVVRDGVTGLLVAGSDPAAYSRTLEMLLDSPDHRHIMGAAGARHARGQDWRTVAAGLLSAYRELAGQRSHLSEDRRQMPG